MHILKAVGDTLLAMFWLILILAILVFVALGIWVEGSCPRCHGMDTRMVGESEALVDIKTGTRVSLGFFAVNKEDLRSTYKERKISYECRGCGYQWSDTKIEPP